MFGIGDIVMYGSQGICKIQCVEPKRIGKQVIDYYVLKPVFNENTCVFVPVDNERLTAKMLAVLTVSQANELVKNINDIDVLKYDNENQKRESYKEILSGGNREKLVSLIKTICFEREERSKVNKKLNMNDEQTLRKAETLLYNELAFVFGAEPDEVKNKIKF